MRRGADETPDGDSLEHGAPIVVGTPGRLMDHLERGSLKLDALEHAGARRSRPHARHGLPRRHRLRRRRRPLRSARPCCSPPPSPEGIARLAGVSCASRGVKLLEQHAGSTKIRQRFYEIAHQRCSRGGRLLLRHYRPVFSTLAFCNTRQQSRDLGECSTLGIAALALNGELDQRERDQVLIQFANRSCWYWSPPTWPHGLDIARLEAVINVDVTPDPRSTSTASAAPDAAMKRAGRSTCSKAAGQAPRERTSRR